MKYSINISKHSPAHWVVQVVLDVKLVKFEMVAGGVTPREGLINCIDGLKKRALDENLTKLMDEAIQDIETML